MPSICLYFKVHHPYRLSQYQQSNYDGYNYPGITNADEEDIGLLADNCYLKTNDIIYDLIKKHKGDFKVSYSLSGIALELFQQYRPDVIESFKKLVNTGCVEILAETYYHSLSSLHSQKEFLRQIQKHSALINELFGVETNVFRNTELIYNNQLAKSLSVFGFKGVLCEGVERVLQGRSPNKIYTAPDTGEFGLLLRNATLSDDIAFRFDDSNWSEHPLTADKFAEWLHAHPENTEVINLFMDYETFGVHKKGGSGIFEFLEALPAAVLANKRFDFLTPSDALGIHYPKDIYDVPETISWEDRSEINCVYCENVMQNNTLKKIYSLENLLLSTGSKKDVELWGRLQTADYFYYMAKPVTGVNNDKYSNPFATPEEAFQHYSNLVVDFEISLIKKGVEDRKKHSSVRSMAYSLF